MEPKIVRSNSVEEFFTPERCLISELWNSPEDENLSIALAKVKPGIKTALHYLEGVDERYLIIAGKGRVEMGDFPPNEVGVGDLVIIPAGISQRITNIGTTDLLFFCVCTPRFRDDCYHDIEEN